MPEDKCDGCGWPPRAGANGITVPLRSCSRCKNAWYHDSSCQRHHYPKHKLICRKSLSPGSTAFRVEERNGRGRCLVANRMMEKGQPLRSEGFEPLVPPVLRESTRTQRCCFCFGMLGEDRIQFSGVFHVKGYQIYFCSEECRASSSPWLKEEEELVSFLSRQVNEPIRVFSTTLLLYRIVCTAIQNPAAMATLDQMQQHQQDFNQSDCAKVHTQAVVYVAKLMLEQKFEGNNLNHVVSEEHLTNIATKIRTNGFSIADGESVAIGIGMYAMASNANHSCCPNALQTFMYGQPGKQPLLLITTCSAVAADDEICISYVDALCPRKIRKEKLKESYYFECVCDRCLDEESEDKLNGFKCFCQRGSTVRLQATGEYMCPECGNTSFSDALSVSEKLRNKSCCLNECKERYNTCRNLFSESSWYFVECSEQYLQALLDEVGRCESENDRLRICNQALQLCEEILENTDKESWNLLRSALLKYKSAKLRLYIQPDPRQAIGNLQDCLRDLKVFYPENHEVIKGVKSCLEQGLT